MNKNRNKIAAMMMVAAITVSSVAMPAEAAISSINTKKISYTQEIEEEEKYGIYLDNSIVDTSGISDITLNNIKDEEFKKFLSENLDQDGNGIISKETVAKVNKIIYTGFLENIEGIGKFKNLKILKLDRMGSYDAVLTGLDDLKELILLERLEIIGHDISSIDLTSNTNLTKLNLSGNRFTNINLKNNTKLRTLDVSANELNELNIDSLGELEYLMASEQGMFDNTKKLESINLSNNTKLKEMNLSNCNLKSLDLSKCDNLVRVETYGNENLESVIFSEKKEELNNVNLSDTKIENINLSNAPKLEILNVGETNLKNLNIINSNNITWLYCSDTKIKELDLTKLPNLEYVYCANAEEGSGENRFETLDISKCPKLIEIHCENTELNSLIVGENSNLRRICCNNNNIQEINLKGCTGIKELFIDNNEIEKIDVSNNELLEYFDCRNNNITSLSLAKNTKLIRISLEGNSIGDLEISDLAPLGQTTLIPKQEKEIILTNNDTKIDLMKIFDKIDTNRITDVYPTNIKISSGQISWSGKAPNKITYNYRANKKLKYQVVLNIVGGATNPDQKPEEKPNEKPNKRHEKIIGSDRYETAAKIADKMGSYNTVILVNSDKSMADGLSAASLSGKKNAPILLVKQDKIPKATMDRINKANNVYIVGGENAISKNVEKKLKESGKKINRIAGKDRYDTSREIAKLLGGYDKAFIVNGAKGEADAMSVSAVAAKYGAPILLTNGKTSIHDKKSGVKYYAIGGTAVIDNKLKEKYSAERVAGSDRYATNREIMDEFYWNSEKVYFAKGDTLIDALTASALAKDNGIVLVSKNKNHSELEGKDTVQVGGMNFEIDFE